MYSIKFKQFKKVSRAALIIMYLRITVISAACSLLFIIFNKSIKAGKLYEMLKADAFYIRLIFIIGFIFVLFYPIVRYLEVSFLFNNEFAFKKTGIFFSVSKSVPYKKIIALRLSADFLMRKLNLCNIAVYTSSGRVKFNLIDEKSAENLFKTYDKN